MYTHICIRTWTYIYSFIHCYTCIGTHADNDTCINVTNLHSYMYIHTIQYVHTYTHTYVTTGKSNWEAVRGTCDTSKAQRICTSALESKRHLLLPLWMRTTLVMWTTESSLLGMVYLHRRSSPVDLQATEVCCIIYYRGRVCS